MSEGRSSKHRTLTRFASLIILGFARSSFPFTSLSSRKKREEAGTKKKAIVTMCVENLVLSTELIM